MSPAAKAEFKKGNASLKQRDYVAAIAAFEAGYALDPNPAFLYAKAQAQRLGGDCRAAVGSYKAFLATRPAPKAVQFTQKNITACERILATSSVPPPIEGKPDRPTESDPTEIDDSFVEPTREPAVKAADRAPVRDRATVRGDREPWWHDGVGVTLALGGVAMLAGGVTFTLLARSDVDDAYNAFDLDDWNRANSAWQRDRTIAGVGYGLGVGLLGAAVIKFAVSSGRSSSAATVGASATPGGGVVILGGRW